MAEPWGSPSWAVGAGHVSESRAAERARGVRAAERTRGVRAAGRKPGRGARVGGMRWALLGIPRAEEQLDSREVSGGLGEAWGEEGPGQTCAQRARC